MLCASLTYLTVWKGQQEIKAEKSHSLLLPLTFTEQVGRLQRHREDSDKDPAEKQTETKKKGPNQAPCVCVWGGRVQIPPKDRDTRKLPINPLGKINLNDY